MDTSVADNRPLGALGRMSMVAGLHVAGLYLIASSLGIVPSLTQETPPASFLIEDHSPPEVRPAFVPPAQRYVPTAYVPAPVAPVDTVANEAPIFAERNDDPPTIPDAAPLTPAQNLVGVRMDSSRPLTQPAYPPSDIRQGNEGTAEIEVFVLPNGRVGDARIVKSAGSTTLDQSALDEARRRWRLLPATRDGEPYAQWHRLKVTFNLRNR